MSWQAFVDDNLMAGGSLTSGAIIGLDGGLWARSTSFPALSAEEFKNLKNGFKENSELYQSGLFLGGAKFVVYHCDPCAVRGKRGTGGTCVRKTNLALIIGFYDERSSPGQSNVVVEKLGDYLSGQGY